MIEEFRDPCTRRDGGRSMGSFFFCEERGMVALMSTRIGRAAAKRTSLGAESRGGCRGKVLARQWRAAGYALLASAVITACSSACRVTEFDAWSTADHIVIRLGHQHPERTITDPVRIAQIAVFAQAHADGWGSPWYGTPVG